MGGAPSVSSGDWRQSADAAAQWHHHEVHGTQAGAGTQALSSHWETEADQTIKDEDILPAHLLTGSHISYTPFHLWGRCFRRDALHLGSGTDRRDAIKFVVVASHSQTRGKSFFQMEPPRTFHEQRGCYYPWQTGANINAGQGRL